MPNSARCVFETGQEPEFVVNHVARWEPAGNGMIRIYISSIHRGGDRVQYSAVGSPSELAEMAREVLRICGEFHNLTVMRENAVH